MNRLTTTVVRASRYVIVFTAIFYLAGPLSEAGEYKAWIITGQSNSLGSNELEPDRDLDAHVADATPLFYYCNTDGVSPECAAPLKLCQLK